MAVVLLLRPLDCFAGGAPRQQAMECCLKGKCAPTASSDECCKNPVPDDNQLARLKAADHSSPLIVITVRIPALISPIFQPLADPVRHPPPDFESTASGLPLLI
jgi:hypothetical protein